jgi:hypothetical protein
VLTHCCATDPATTDRSRCSSMGRHRRRDHHQSTRYRQNIDHLVECHDPAKIFANPGQQATEHDTTARWS